MKSHEPSLPESIFAELRADATPRWILVVLLLTVSIVLLYAGEIAIRTGKIENEPDPDEPAGMIEFEFEGADARRVGAGFLSFAAMLIVWGVALLWPEDLGKPWLGKLAALLASLLFFASILIWFPPYHFGSRWAATMVNGFIALIAIAWAVSRNCSPAAEVYGCVLPQACLVLAAIGLVFGGVNALAGLIAFFTLLPFQAMNVAWLIRGWEPARRDSGRP